MTTPNMNLFELQPGITTGPDYATRIVSNFSLIDSHDHSPGKGASIPVSAIEVNDSLAFNGNGPVDQGKSQFRNLSSALSAGTDYRSLFVVNGDLFYLDNSGNSVQITNSGSISGATGNITGLSSPASVTFATNKYSFKDTATSFAIMESSDVRLFEDSSSSITEYVALRSPGSLSATYTLTFPTGLPASTRYMASNSTGDLSFETADSIGSAMTATGANDIANTRTRATGTTVASGGVAISSVCAFFTTTSTSYVDIPNLSVTITTSGRPVFIALVGLDTNPFPSSQLSRMTIFRASSGTAASIAIVRDSTILTSTEMSSTVSGATAVGQNIPSSSISHIDAVAAGTYTYKIQVQVASLTTFQIDQTRLAVFEL